MNELDFFSLGRKNHLQVVFSFLAFETMKTTIYIDGYNLYFGSIKNTNYKWLDVVKLFSFISNQQNPQTQVISVKYFTAPVKGKIASHGLKAVTSQRLYHIALSVIYPEVFELIEGTFLVETGRLPQYKKHVQLDKKDTVKVWKLEEKKTDVNITLSLYRDSAKGMEQVILVSNDSDLVPAFEAIKEDFPDTRIGVVIPRMKENGKQARPANAELSNLADWTRKHINEDELSKAQLPDIVPRKAKKTIFKPDYW